MQESISLAIGVALMLVGVEGFGHEDPALFCEPNLVYAGKEPLNADARIMYPSPAVFDIDQDGKDELVIGSIFGGLYSCEDMSDAEGIHRWGVPVRVLTVDGEPIQLNNW